MKRLLLLALCALFALNAGARTLYVDAKRPNNKGNGLSAKKAKKTIQAAINAAKKGDTILVLPGTYAPIKTNNKNISIKSTRGVNKTKIRGQLEWNWDRRIVSASAQLGRVFHQDRYVMTWTGDYPNQVYRLLNVGRIATRGMTTQLIGFRLQGVLDEYGASFHCVVGGTVKSCQLEGFQTPMSSYGSRLDSWQQAAWNSKLVGCTIRNLYCTTGAPLFEGSTLQRCKVQSNEYDFGPYGREPMIVSSRFYNCLFRGNHLSGAGNAMFTNSVLVNCSFVGNTMKTGDDAGPFATKSKFYNCVLWNNSRQCAWREYDYDAEEEIEHSESTIIRGVGSGNICKNTDKTNRNPKFTSAYKLKKGSYCIDSGKLTKAQRKLVGTKDLAGKKRIRGKAIDRGCYEY